MDRRRAPITGALLFRELQREVPLHGVMQQERLRGAGMRDEHMKSLNLKNALAAFAAVFDGVSGAAAPAALNVEIEIVYAEAVRTVDEAMRCEQQLTFEERLDVAALRSLIGAYRALPADYLTAFLFAKDVASRRSEDAHPQRHAVEARVRAALIAVDGIPTEALAKSNLSVLIPHLAHYLPADGEKDGLAAHLRKEADSLKADTSGPSLHELFGVLDIVLHAVPGAAHKPSRLVRQSNSSTRAASDCDQAESLVA